MFKRELEKDVVKEENRLQDNKTGTKVKDSAKNEREGQIKIKIRFDYKGKQKPARFFWGGKNPQDVAHEAREHQASVWRNIPLQGINVEKIDLGEIYQVFDEELEDNVSYAPLELIARADSLEDLLWFVVKEEFRRIDILELKTLLLTNKEIERLFFKINKQYQGQINQHLKEIK